MNIKNYYLTFFILLIYFTNTQAESEIINKKVNITQNIPYIDVIDHHNKNIRIERIQDITNKISNSFSKTSRPCPPFCIQPFKIGGRIKTVGEIEVLSFIKDKVMTGKGLLIDARTPEWFEKSTIPTAINIPFYLVDRRSHKNKKSNKKILALLGVVERQDDTDFSNAKELMIFCNGSWCSQAPRAINNLIRQGYLGNKLYWYRGGLQNWLMLGLTSVSS